MIKKSAVKKVYKMDQELQMLLETESDLYKKAMDNKKREHKVKRGEEEVTITEGELFEELRACSQMGVDAKVAREKLAEIYPDLFKVVEKREKKNKELNEYILTHFGFDPRQMTIASYLKMTEAVLDYKIDEKLKNKK